MSLLRDLSSKLHGAPVTIALSEGEDPRIIAAAVAARKHDIARLILVGDKDIIARALRDASADDVDGISIQDPADSPLHDAFVDAFYVQRQHKHITRDSAAKHMRDPLFFAAMLVQQGHASGTLGGAVATTTATVRAALQVIGKAADAATVSSFFLMRMPDEHFSGRQNMIFSDCGMVIDPGAQQLAAIAQASAQSCRAILGETPRVAMLSFSTLGSAKHAAVSKVAAATQFARAAAPDLIIDGEIQFDTAFAPDVAATKAPESAVAGQANVFIFPNLDAGNIGYKIAQRIGGATAIGPILQGLKKPANDLSRGCTSDDVLHMIAVTAVQAISTKPTADQTTTGQR